MNKVFPGSIGRKSKGYLTFPIDECGVGSIPFEGLHRFENFNHLDAVVCGIISGGGVGRRIDRR